MRKALGTMMIGAALLMGSGISAMAAEACYTYKVVSPSINCDANNSKSGDFTSPCGFAEGHVEKVQVACPVTAGNSGGSSGGGSGSSYGDNCACDHSSTGGWH
jgi:hypothetical protein